MRACDSNWTALAAIRRYNSGMTTKQKAHAVIDELPEDATWQQIAYEMYVRGKLEAGVADIKQSDFVDHEQIKQRVDRWRIPADPTGRTPPTMFI